MFSTIIHIEQSVTHPELPGNEACVEFDLRAPSSSPRQWRLASRPLPSLCDATHVQFAPDYALLEGRHARPESNRCKSKSLR